MCADKLYFLCGGGLTFAAAAGLWFLSPAAAGAALLFGGGLLAGAALLLAKHRARLRAINQYLLRVCAGEYDLRLADNAEGELSILQNNLYKVVVLLQTSNEALAKDRAQLADALADISHQLKTPLTASLLLSDLLGDEPEPARRGELASMLSAELDRMRRLVTALLKLSRLDAGAVTFQNVPVSICRVVEESLQPFCIPLELKNITVLRPAEDFTFCGDLNWSVEAVQNLVKNALGHLPQNGTLRFRTEKTTVYYALTVEDNGSGVDPADLPHIFERFYNGARASAEHVGIGLALSKAILAEENATISVESTPGRGTAFTIRFYKSPV